MTKGELTYSLADLFEQLADAVPERLAVVAGEQRRSYQQLEQRCNQLANFWLAQGLGQGDHIGICARNRVEWVEAMMAAFKIRAVPININYRYTVPEMRYIFENADLKALVYERRYSATVMTARETTPMLKLLLSLEDDSPPPSPPSGQPYEQALATGSAARAFPSRSNDDLFMLYTGGTTGYPKGTMWRHEDIFFAALQGGDPWGQPIDSPEALADSVLNRDYAIKTLSPAPMMHGGGIWNTLIALLSGGTIMLYCEPSFDAERLLQIMEIEKPNSLVVIGDAMARPVVEALERGQYDTSCLLNMGSGGAILSKAIKDRLRALLPNIYVVDSFGASETGSLGMVQDMDDKDSAGARFTVPDYVAVLDEQLRPLPPGSDQVGMLARRGHLPLGYYKDEEKTAASFRTDAQGCRWVVPGDYARVLEDGTVLLLGRGSVCINSGGEKIFPEEVEAALKGHPQVYDAVVTGTPHTRFGEQVTAVVQPRPGQQPTLESLRQHCAQQLADYKCPRAMVLVESAPRTPVGKPDYRATRQLAEQALAEQKASTLD